MFELKPLHPDSILTALEKATRYRLLGESGEAESICLDVLRVVPDPAGAREPHHELGDATAGSRRREEAENADAGPSTSSRRRLRPSVRNAT